MILKPLGTFLNLHEPGLIYTAAALFVLSALSVKRIIILRALYLMGSILFFTYGIQVNVLEIMFWNGVNILINAIRIWLYLVEIMPWFIKDDNLKLYNDFFKKFMLPGHFRKIIKFAQIKNFKDTTILAENVSNRELYFIIHINGELIVESKDFLTQLHDHSFFGEMSFLKGQKTSACIRIQGDVRCYHWSEKNLQSFKKRYPTIFSTLILILSHDLVQKIQPHAGSH